MPSKPRSRKSPRALPSREEVLAFIAEHPGQAGKREIARAFGVSGGDRIGLKALLKDLAADGLVERDRKRLKRPADLPSVAVLVVTGRDRDGELLAAPAEWPAGEDVPTFLVATDRKSKLPPPGVGDQVLARLTPAKDDAPASARVIKVLERKPATALGVFRTSPAGPRIEPVSRKEKALLVDPGATNGAQEGDLVSVTVTRSTRHGVDRARVTEVIGSLKSEKAVSLIAIHAHNIPNVFPPEVLAEAEKAKAAPLSGREDWRKMPLLTIDPPDAKDHDDAVHAEPDSDKANPGGFIVTVAIADVAWYVRPGSELDVEAVKRGNSVYFPDRVVPMLPERISNDLCSLREGEDRPALAVRMVFGSDGRKRSHRFHRIMMRSAGKLSYAEAQHVFDGGTSGPGNRVRAPLLALWDAYQVLARGRDEREPLALDLPERKVIVGKDGGIERIIVPERLEAHRLIEEYMIQANVAAAETLEARKSPLVYRIHDAPSLAKLEALRDFLASIDLKLPRSGNLRPANFNQILVEVGKSEHGPLLHEVVLRSQAQAEYSPENIGHFGLNLRRYAHFTSPIRRYADLIVHRALIRALKLGEGGLPDGAEVELPVIAAAISAAERRAMVAERETIDRLVAHWLADRIGAEFKGKIAGVTRAGLFVKLDETGADGFVPMSTIGADYYVYDESRHAVIGRRTGEMYRLGDPVEVKLVEAAPVAGALRFELLTPGQVLPRSQRPAAARPARSKRPQTHGRFSRR
ncbi:MAG TPA: ribonuclease R [Bauldia sp.]|nr:ribonuclease R [Bauldia sp.]